MNLQRIKGSGLLGAERWSFDQSFNLLSGISSRPLSFEAMIATCYAEDHDLQVRDLICIVEVVVRLSEDGPWMCPARKVCEKL